MTHAIRIHRTGGPEVLQWDAIAVGKPGPGQVRLRHTACGLNYIDIYMREGVYPPGNLPAVLGMEAAGVIEELGEGVTEFKKGERVAYPIVAAGSAQERVVDAERLVKIPDTIDDETAGTMMLKGLTAHYLLYRTYPVKAGDTILVYAAAGGVGLMLCQWAKHLGATVIGGVGPKEKARSAVAHGCDHVIFYREDDVVERVREITHGEGVSVVYGGLGQRTFAASLDCLRPFGVMVTCGNVTGQVEPFAPKILAAKGSLYVTRPTLATHVATRALLLEGAKRLFEMVSQGIVKNHVNQSYALQDAAQAHRDIEARRPAQPRSCLDQSVEPSPLNSHPRLRRLRSCRRYSSISYSPYFYMHHFVRPRARLLSCRGRSGLGPSHSDVRGNGPHVRRPVHRKPGSREDRPTWRAMICSPATRSRNFRFSFHRGSCRSTSS